MVEQQKASLKDTFKGLVLLIALGGVLAFL